MRYQLTAVNLGEIITKMHSLIAAKKKVFVTIGEKRSLSANAQQHVWYKAISDHTGYDVKTVGLMCKRDHGLPIILAGEYGPKVAWMLERCNYYQLTNDQQLKFIDMLAVTSIMSTKEHNQYRDSLQSYWHDQGLNIDYKE